MWAKKIQWKTTDDSAGDAVSVEAESVYGVTLEAQRIRVFTIEYVIANNNSPLMQ
jgi:hypothetical protein